MHFNLTITLVYLPNSVKPDICYLVSKNIPTHFFLINLFVNIDHHPYDQK